MSDVSDKARTNVTSTFGDYETYREGLTGRKKKKAEKHYNKLIADERKQLEKSAKKKEKIFPAKDVVLIANEANLVLDRCTVSPDHEIIFGSGKKKRTVRINREPHVLLIPNKIIQANFGFLVSMILSFFLPVGGFKYRVYTVRSEGEVTHDPSLDHYNKLDKIRMEELLKIQGAMAKANFAKKITEGMKDKIGLWEMFPYIAIILIVLFFIIGFAVVPNM